MEQTLSEIIVIAYTITPILGLIWLGMVRENRERKKMLDKAIKLLLLHGVARGRRR